MKDLDRDLQCLGSESYGVGGSDLEGRLLEGFPVVDERVVDRDLQRLKSESNGVGGSDLAGRLLEGCPVVDERVGP